MTNTRVYPDLSIYTNQLWPFQLVGVRNIGWIDISKKSYSVGVMAEELRLKMFEISCGEKTFRPLVETEREAPCCPICGEIRIRKSERAIFVKSELWIPGENVIYASPILILHNIEVHNYLPPTPYLEALEALEKDLSFSGQDVFQDMLNGSAWVYRNRNIRFWKE